MEMRDLLEKMMKFAGEKVGQKPGDQWRGSDKAPPGKKLVGDSILKDLSKGKTPKSKEQELSEEFQAFLEAEFKDTVDKRPARKNARPARGHEPKSGYKTVKADESAMSDKDIELQDYRSMSHKEFQTAYGMTKTEWINKNKALVIQNPKLKQALGLDEGVPYKTTNPHPASKDPIVAKVLKQMRPGLTGLDMNNEAFLYFAYEIGKMRAREMWKDYGPAIKYFYQSGIGVNEDIKSSNLQQAIENFLSQHEDASEAVALDAIDYLARTGQLEKFANEIPYLKDQFDELAEGWESGPEEYQEPYDDADDAYDRQRQEKIDTEAEAEWAKLPKVSTYKLVGRGPNMEPNYEFGGKEYDTLEQAIEARKQLMADPKTPHPEHIGISTLTRVVNKEQTNEAVYTAPKNREEYDAKMAALQDLQTDPNTANDEELQKKIIIYMNNLQKVAHQQGWLNQYAEESRGHKIIATKLKDVERAKKFASGELKIPTPQERQAQLKRLEKVKPVKEYGADQPTGTAAPGQPQNKNIAIATNAMKSATGTTAPAPMLDKALDTAMQGKPMDAQGAKALQPTMNVIAQAAKDPKLAGQFKTLAQQAKQSQLKQS